MARVLHTVLGCDPIGRSTSQVPAVLSVQCGPRIFPRQPSNPLRRLPVEQQFPGEVIVFLHRAECSAQIRIDSPVSAFEQVSAKKARVLQALILRASEQAWMP